MSDKPSQLKHEEEKDDNAPAPNLTPTEARQGRKEGVVRYVLGFGFPLALAALLIIVIIFILSN